MNYDGSWVSSLLSRLHGNVFSSPPSRISLGHFFEELIPQTCERLLWPDMPDKIDDDSDGF